MELRKVICDTCGAKSLTNIPEGTRVRCFGCEGGMVTHEELKPSSVAEGIGAAIRCAYEQAERFSQELNTSKPTNPKRRRGHPQASLILCPADGHGRGRGGDAGGCPQVWAP